MKNLKRTLHDIIKLSKNEIHEIFDNGKTPDIKKLIGYEFRGYNLTPVATILGIRKFTKGFYLKDGKMPFGYNIPVLQNSPDKPWTYKPSDKNPKRFGFYSVTNPVHGTKEYRHPHALLLNYEDGDNSFFEGSFLRDYFVQVDEGNDDLYVGDAYIALSHLRIFSSFFVFERLRKSNFKQVS